MKIIDRVKAWLQRGTPRHTCDAQRDAAYERAAYLQRLANLEHMIDKVGRDAVFSRARSIGWRDECPPLWVWECIVAEMLAERKPSQRAAEVLH